MLFSIQLGTTIQFRLSPSLHGCQVILYTNHPLSTGTKFCRSKYSKVNWALDRQNEETYANIVATIAGSFQFYFTKDGYVEKAYSLHVCVRGIVQL